VEIDPVGGLAHNKVMVIDEKVLLTGSYNWTNAANTKNAENLLVIEDQKMIQIFKENWMRRAGKL
jgi:phospholipase D